jgi:hypothetical protein
MTAGEVRPRCRNSPRPVVKLAGERGGRGRHLARRQRLILSSAIHRHRAPTGVSAGADPPSGAGEASCYPLSRNCSASRYSGFSATWVP